MTPPQYEKVVEDCDKALALDKKYVKALNRRATALEALERYQDALRGMHLLYMWLRIVTIIFYYG